MPLVYQERALAYQLMQILADYLPSHQSKCNKSSNIALQAKLLDLMVFLIRGFRIQNASI